jgi:two-component system, NtrC family, sensor kinase
MLPDMPRSLAAVLTDRLDRINALANDLARANGGESPVTQAFADAIKREVDGISRALRRPQRYFTGAQLGARPDRSVVSEHDISDERRLREQLIHSERWSAVGQLVASVAHEINNPLQTVMGFTELLLEAEQRPEVRTELELIRTHASRVAWIVHSLLLFARRDTLERSIADLNEIVRSTLALRSFDFHADQISVRQDCGDDLPMIVVNHGQIQQIVLNLVLNAEHAIRGTRRPGTIGVRTGQAADSVFVDVSDDGPGVPGTAAGRIFEPFFTTKPVGQGTGLGLSVSLGIAQAHGGSLALVPSERGACFRLTLPVRGGRAC